MQTTGLFESFIKEIPCELGKPLYVVPLGDIHHDSPMHAHDKFKRFIDEWADKIDRGYNVVFVGMGDYLDGCSTSERGIVGDKRLHESTRENLNQWALDKTHDFLKTIEPISKNIIGMIEGNHYYDLMGGQTTTQYMCSQIGAYYMGVLCLFRLRLRIDGASHPVDFYAHHGKGAARLVGGSINRIQQMAEGCRADVYLMGHDHKLATGKSSSIELTKDGDIKDRTQTFVRTGSFLKAFEKGQVSYIADMCGNPCELGAPYITLTPRRVGDKKKRRTVDIRVTI